MSLPQPDSAMPDVHVRLDECERRLNELEHDTRDINVYRQQILDLWTVIRETREEVSSLRRVIVSAAISFAGGALILAATIVLAAK